MRQALVERVRRQMLGDGFDAVVLSSPENIAWLAGFVVPSQPLMRWRHAAAVVTPDTTAFMCVDMEETTVRERLPGMDVRVWEEFTGDPMATLADLLKDVGSEYGAIGLELDYLPARDFSILAEYLDVAQFLPFDEKLGRLRQLKIPEELDLLHRLSRISDKAIADAFAAVGPGSTELDLASVLTSSVYEQGAESFKLMIVATGERSEMPNVGPSERVLNEGDVCRVEIFSVLDGYQAGVCRTGVVGKPPVAAEKIWENLVACKYLLLDMIAPGVSTAEVWQRFRSKFDELGLPSISFVGHGIGVHLHEEPYLGPYSDAALQPGMVFGIEPLVYKTGLGFGLQLKDMVAVTDTGCDLLSDYSNTDQLATAGSNGR